MISSKSLDKDYEDLCQAVFVQFGRRKRRRKKKRAQFLTSVIKSLVFCWIFPFSIKYMS